MRFREVMCCAALAAVAACGSGPGQATFGGEVQAQAVSVARSSLPQTVFEVTFAYPEFRWDEVTGALLNPEACDVWLNQHEETDVFWLISDQEPGWLYDPPNNAIGRAPWTSCYNAIKQRRPGAKIGFYDYGSGAHSQYDNRNAAAVYRKVDAIVLNAYFRQGQDVRALARDHWRPQLEFNRKKLAEAGNRKAKIIFLMCERDPFEGKTNQRLHSTEDLVKCARVLRSIGVTHVSCWGDLTEILTRTAAMVPQNDPSMERDRLTAIDQLAQEKLPSFTPKQWSRKVKAWRESCIRKGLGYAVQIQPLPVPD